MKVSNNPNPLELTEAARSRKGNKANALNSQKNDSNEAPSAASLRDTANIDISSEAKTVAAANQIAKSENVDQEKIDRIKAMIHAGSYKPDYGKIADKVLNEQLLQELS